MKKFFKKIGAAIGAAGKFCLSTPNKKENIIQYVFRHFILTDSSGEPSYTVTILVYVMAIFGCVTYVEMKIATSEVKVVNTQTNEIITHLKGISPEFLFVLAPLVGLVVFFFKLRANTNTPKHPKGDSCNCNNPETPKGDSCNCNNPETPETDTAPTEQPQTGVFSTVAERAKDIVAKLL